MFSFIKSCLIAGVLLCLANLDVRTAFAEAPDKIEVSERIRQAQASNDVSAIIGSMPELDKLWLEKPEDYVRSAKMAGDVLQAASADPKAKQALVGLFVSLAQKTLPADNGEAAARVEIKREAILEFLNFDLIRSEKGPLLGLAKCVGEIRARMIPNYDNRGTSQPGIEILAKKGVNDASGLTNVQDKLDYEKAVEENKRDLVLNKLQLELMESDSALSFQLLHNVSAMNIPATERAEWMQKVSSLAHLTGEEQQQLQ